MTNVLATPLIESAKAPGLCQYLNPIVRGPIPPALMQIARMKNTHSERTLILKSKRSAKILKEVICV